VIQLIVLFDFTAPQRLLKANIEKKKKEQEKISLETRSRVGWKFSKETKKKYFTYQHLKAKKKISKRERELKKRGKEEVKQTIIFGLNFCRLEVQLCVGSCV
jgi:hypothetical protein